MEMFPGDTPEKIRHALLQGSQDLSDLSGSVPHF